jgi:cyclopropane-fatty-acyl-phospholipid synthase
LHLVEKWHALIAPGTFQIVGYDWAPTIFSSMLSSEQTYSCAFWPDDLGGVRGDINAGFTPGDLESAQLVKINHVLDLARVSEGTRLLEFGSGWGSLAIEAARRGAQVDTLTLSIEQQRVAATRIRKLGLDRQIRVHLLDYRKVPDVFQRASFDAFAGVEMVEVSDAEVLPLTKAYVVNRPWVSVICRRSFIFSTGL